MPNDVHDRLDDELRKVARALVAEAPEPPAASAVSTGRQSAGRSGAWRALAAATVIALAGAGGLYLLLRDRSGDDETATIPVVPGEITWPAVLPIVDGHDDAYGYINAFPVDFVRAAQATLAKRVDGALVDPVVVEVGTDYGAVHSDAEPVDIVGVFEQTARVYTSLDELTPLAVVIGDNPYIAVAGVDPMSFLNRVSEDFVRHDVPDDGGPITLEFGELPEGYEVIYNEAEPDEVEAFVTTYLPSTNSESFVHVGVGPLLIGRDAAPVDVNGTAGWLVTDGAFATVTWPAEGDTFALVGATSADDALALARSLRFVPLDEWAAHYDVDVDAIEPGPPVAF